MNDHQFDDATVRAIYEACAEAGIDYLELGYKASQRIFAPDEYGTWKFCSEDDVRRIVGDNDTPLKLSVMADAERTDYHEDILPREQSVIDLIRVATYIHQIPTAMDMIKDAHDKGYETAINIMAISHTIERELDEALMQINNETKVVACYIVDSFGALYSEDIDYYVMKYKKVFKDKEVGIHAHNNQQLAFANTLEAIILGANRVDASMAGIGRGAGNCAMELLIGFLRNPKFNVFYDAPSLVIICGDKRSPSLKVDCALAASYLMFSAAARGLGTCWVDLGARIDDPKLREEIGLTDDLVIVAPIIIGCPKAIPAIPPRNEPIILKTIS